MTSIESSVTKRRPIEIRLSDDYRRAKRNHLFASSAVIVLAFAAGDAINVPGFPDNKIGSALALVLTWFAALFFADEFRIEYSLARVRNSEVNADSTAAEIDYAFGDRLGAIQSLTKEIEQIVARLRPVTEGVSRFAVKQMANTMPRVLAGTDRVIERLKAIKANQPVEPLMAEVLNATEGSRELIEPLQALSMHWDNLAKAVRPISSPDWRGILDDLRAADIALKTAFERTHQAIYAQQRYAFRRDFWIAVVLFVAASAGVVTHIGIALASAMSSQPAPRVSASPTPRPSTTPRAVKASGLEFGRDYFVGQKGKPSPNPSLSPKAEPTK